MQRRFPAILLALACLMATLPPVLAADQSMPAPLPTWDKLTPAQRERSIVLGQGAGTLEHRRVQSFGIVLPLGHVAGFNHTTGLDVVVQTALVGAGGHAHAVQAVAQHIG